MKLGTLLHVTALLAPVAAAASDGGWHSGGGFLSSVDENPWFIQQSTEVARYCIELDTDNFGAPESVVRSALNKALDYWKEELKKSSEGGGSGITVGPKKLKEVACSPDVDLRFQFGILDETQRPRIDNPRAFVAAAVMTDYNNEILRGRGFVYVSPERGPLALERLEVTANRWTLGHGRLLELTLVHELGHVFGVSHEKGGFMSSGFVEDNVVDPRYAPAMAETTGVPSILQVPTAGSQRSYWGQKDDNGQKKPVYWKLDYSERGTKIVFSEGDSWEGPFKPILQGTAAPGGNSAGAFTTMWLPKEQQILPVYTGTETKIWALMGVPNVRYFGTLTDMRGTKVADQVFRMDEKGITIEYIPVAKCPPDAKCNAVGIRTLWSATHFNPRVFLPGSN